MYESGPRLRNFNVKKCNVCFSNKPQFMESQNYLLLFGTHVSVYDELHSTDLLV